MSKTAAIILGLERLGFNEKQTRSTKFRYFVLGDTILKVGKAGSVRKMPADISLSDSFYVKVIRGIGEWRVPAGEVFKTEQWRQIFDNWFNGAKTSV